MQLELNLSDVLLSLKIVFLFPIFHVVGLQKKILRFLEEVVNTDARDKVRIQVVIDALSPTDLLFYRLGSLLLQLVQYDERVRLGESVQIRQVSQRERQSQRLLQGGCLGCPNAILNGLKSGVVDVLQGTCYALSTHCPGIVFCFRSAIAHYCLDILLSYFY